MHVVATTNSLFETTDKSCQLISGIPTLLLIDPCENCTYFCHKNGRNWHFSGFPFMVSDNSTFIFYCPRYPRAKPGTSASTIYVSVLAGSQCRSFYEQSESAAPHFPSLE